MEHKTPRKQQIPFVVSPAQQSIICWKMSEGLDFTFMYLCVCVFLAKSLMAVNQVGSGWPRQCTDPFFVGGSLVFNPLRGTNAFALRKRHGPSLPLK